MSARPPPATPAPADHDSPGWLWLLSPWLIAVALLACLPLSGCKRLEVQAAEDVKAAEEARLKPRPVIIFIDSETGCEYVAGGYLSALTPRLGRDGCRPSKVTDRSN